MELLQDPMGAAWAVCLGPSLGPEALGALQRRRLAALLRHAMAHSPAHGRRLAGVDPERTPLERLPVLRKAEFMRALDGWMADPCLTASQLRRFTQDGARVGDAFAGRFAVWESSGSRGEPGLFVHDEGALAVYDALEVQRPAPLRPLQRLWDPFWLGERVAFVGATGGHFASQSSLQRLRRRAPWLAAHWQGFSILQPQAALLAALQAFRPTVLTTYPTAASMLAEAQAEGRLDLAPQEIWTGGETLGAAQRARICEVFRCGLRQSYGASEFLPIAAECRHDRLHVNADWVILEPVDDRGQPVPPGTLSHDVLLTNLANGAQPLIRYALGDRVRMPAERCTCGSGLPLIEVEGRCDDLLVLAGAGGRPVRLLPLAVTTLLEESAGLFHFRLEQTGPSALRLHVPGAADAAATRAIRVLRRHAREQGARPLRLALRCGQPLPRGRSGKLQRIVATAQPPKRASR